MKIRIAIIGATVLTLGLFAQDMTKSVWDGVYTEAQATRGQGLYNENCASCHGSLLTGGETAPPLQGGEFMSNWNGLSAGELFERIRTSMPIDRPGKLSRETNTDILAYIFKANEFPTGSTELSTKTEFLKQIKVEPKKNK